MTDDLVVWDEFWILKTFRDGCWCFWSGDGCNDGGWFSWSAGEDACWAAFILQSLKLVARLVTDYWGAVRSTLDVIVDALTRGTFLCPSGEWSANYLSFLVVALAHVLWDASCAVASVFRFAATSFLTLSGLSWWSAGTYLGLVVTCQRAGKGARKLYFRLCACD